MENFISSHREPSYVESNLSMGTNMDMHIRPDVFWRAKSNESSGESTFGDQDCGEPESVQKLVLDFTLDPERDTLLERQKCNDFWMFIRKQHHLNYLKVYPSETESGSGASETEIELDSKGSTSPESKSIHDNSLKIHTAISLFSLPENQDRLNSALTTKMRASDCSLRDSHYTINDVYKIPNEEKKHCEICPKSACDPAFCICPKPRAKQKGPQPTPKTLCKIFDDWDKKHPNSMEPPGHPPHLVNQCKLQRLE